MENREELEKDLYNAMDVYGHPIYTVAQIKEMTDDEIADLWENLEGDTILIQALREESKNVESMREESGNFGLTVRITIALGLGLLTYWLLV